MNQAMYCPRCGLANDDTSSVCANCGTNLGRQPRPTRPEVRRVSKSFYLGSVAAAGVVGVGLITVAVLRIQRHPVDFQFLFPLVLGEMTLVYAGTVALVLWYKAWKAIQDGYARISAGRAVGLLFVPFYNLYWVFQAYWGFAKDYNALIGRHQIGVPRLPAALFLLWCVMTLAGLVLAFVPIARLWFPFVSLGVWLAVTNSVCNGINRLARYPPA